VPQTELQIAGSHGSFQFDPTPSTSTYHAKFTIDDIGLKIGHNSGVRDIEFQTNSNTALTISSSGNVGIGTTNPLARLQIAGAGNDNSTVALNVTNASSTSMLYVRNDGNVGIGTTAPGTRLQITSPNASDALTLGSSSGGFYLTNSNYLYGLSAGSFSNGNSWLQVGRTDGTATAYNLLLNPSGGNVGIGRRTDQEIGS